MHEFLTLEDVLELHAGQIKSYGGSEGLRSSDLLQSAAICHRPAWAINIRSNGSR